MKGTIKCFGLCLALPIMLGLSLNASLDVSALKHEWTALPLFRYYSADHNDHTVPLSIDYYNSSNVPSDFSPVNPYYFTGNYSEGVCTYSSVKSGLYKNPENHHYNIGTFYEYYDTLTPYSPTDSRMCQLRNHSYDSSNTPSYNWATVPTYSGLSNYSQYPARWNPYWFKFDGFYLKNSAVDSSGVHYSHSLSSSELFGVAPGKFQTLIIPLAVDESVIGTISAGRPIEISGTFVFPGATPSSGFSFSPGFNENGIFSAYMRGNNIGTPISAPCTVNLLYSGGVDSSSSHMLLNYSCVFSNVPATQYPFFHLTISDTTDHYVWDSDIDWRWAGMFITTDNDTTPGADPSVAIHAANPNDIPGSATSDFASDNADWFASLTRLFHFDFTNPFQPIFGMFKSGDTCASIPNLAGMLHSNETQVCAFFPSTVRDVLTPVFSLASMMLVFGFIVRWLGSSSGNMFEDQTTHKWGNTQIGQQRHGKY